MKLLLSIALFGYIIFTPLITCANGYALFPTENISQLSLIDTDPYNSTFILQDRNGEKIIGSIGDFVGQSGLEIVEITDYYILVESVEFVIDKDENEKEQPVRMRIPLSQMFYGKGVR